MKEGMKVSDESAELHFGAKRDICCYGLSMTGKTAFIEQLLTQSSKISDLIVITDSVEPGADENKPDWNVMTRIKRITKVSIRPTSDLFLAGKPNQFCPAKMKALFAAKKRWTDIVLDDWERYLSYRVGNQSVFNYLAGLLSVTAGRSIALILRHQFGGVGVSDTQMRAEFPYTIINNSLNEKTVERMRKEFDVGGVSISTCLAYVRDLQTRKVIAEGEEREINGPWCAAKTSSSTPAGQQQAAGRFVIADMQGNGGRGRLCVPGL
jgi:hypothetical protein